MINIAGILTFLCLMGTVFWYCPLILRRRVKPAPATWIILFLAMNLAMLSYSAIPGRTMIENVTLYAATLGITIILLFIIVVLLKSGEFNVAFDGMQRFCLAVMMLALVYWAFNKDQSNVTFWTTQTLLVVGYIATILRAIKLKTAFDSIGNWSFIFAGSVIGSIPAIAMWSSYGMANSARAVVSSGITVFILIYYDRKSGGLRWSDEISTLADFYFHRFRSSHAVAEADDSVR